MRKGLDVPTQLGPSFDSIPWTVPLIYLWCVPQPHPAHQSPSASSPSQSLQNWDCTNILQYSQFWEWWAQFGLLIARHRRRLRIQHGRLQSLRHRKICLNVKQCPDGSEGTGGAALPCACCYVRKVPTGWTERARNRYARPSYRPNRHQNATHICISLARGCGKDLLLLSRLQNTFCRRAVYRFVGARIAEGTGEWSELLVNNGIN